MTFSLRRAEDRDAGEIAAVLGYGVKIDMPFLPILHTDDENLNFTRDKMLKECDVRVATTDRDGVTGFVAFKDGWIHQMYVHGNHRRSGVGTALLAEARKNCNELQLWAFQKNMAARAFYKAHGFRPAETTDGLSNEEKEPDVRYVWKREI